jgi:hypothetical protein
MTTVFPGLENLEKQAFLAKILEKNCQSWKKK